ncbi:MAG: DUF2165 domain-containing protein [Pseudomonadota bacterium]
MDSGTFYQRSQRALKAVIAISIGVFGLLTGLTNIVDYDSNWGFVQQVMGMQGFPDWFDKGPIADRAIASEPLQRLAYSGIIIGELLTGLLFMIGGILLTVSVWRPAPSILGKALAVSGGIVAMLVWYLGFSVIASEWFGMWASVPNAPEKAYTFATFILLAVVYITRPE